MTEIFFVRSSLCFEISESNRADFEKRTVPVPTHVGKVWFPYSFNNQVSIAILGTTSIFSLLYCIKRSIPGFISVFIVYVLEEHRK